MKNTIRQVMHSPRFLIGFIILIAMLLTITIYPLFVPDNPLQSIGLGTFFKPGQYFSLQDALDTENTYTFKLDDAAANRLASKLSDSDREAMKEWLVANGVPEDAIDIHDTDQLLLLWGGNYDSSVKISGMTAATRRYYGRLDDKLNSFLSSEGLVIMRVDDGELEQIAKVNDTDYVHTADVANIVYLPLGTDNFGRNVLTELVSALGTSLLIGLVAGLIATAIGLTLGLLAGYIGGWVDDIIMFFVNLFTVIPSFMLLILISFSIGQAARGAVTVAIVIGCTSWVWTARAVRSQVVSLRDRDHVNLSKLSGHSLVRIITTDILPYIASYVVMALILQISSGILAEAQLSILGLGPSTTDVPTLGLMMYWSMAYSAHMSGAWWAYFPVIFSIALLGFSLNLMNTGLDQVFNPTLRD